jgi:DnaJ-class molecular chaperone
MDTTAALVLTPIIVYVVSVFLWPYARCRVCRGSTTSRGSSRHRWNVCGRCGGSGQRVRLGARLLGRVR